MDPIEVFSASAGTGQVLTDCFEPSSYRSAHEVGTSNRMHVRFETQGTLPEWIDWRLETSHDGGLTWQSGPATVVWGGIGTPTRTVSMRPGTAVSSVEIPGNCSVRLLARRRGGGPDTTVLGVGTFENVAPKRRRDEDASARPRPVPRDLWGRPIAASAATGKQRY